MRYLRVLAAWLLLLGLVVGIPALLVLTVGNPLDGWPDLVTGDLSDTAVIDVLAAVAYLAWAQFALAVILEAFAATAQVRFPARLPFVFAGQRRLAYALITAALLATNAASSIRTPGLVPRVTVAAVAPAVATVPIAASNGAPGHDLEPSPTGARPASPPTSAKVSTYTVRAEGPGTYWDLAERFLGDGRRWTEIWQLNHGRRQEDGAVMTSPGLLRVGWTVVLPTGLHADSPPGTYETEVTVARGDSLWSISESHLGDGRSWPTLFRLNKGKVQQDGGRLTDPDLIQPGWVLALPNVPVESPEPAPAASSPPAEAPGTPRPVVTPGAQSVTPEDPSTGSAIGTPNTPTTEARPTDAPRVHDQPAASPSTGVELPGGWVGLPFAAAISAAAAMVWIRRRQRHRYLPLGDDHDDDGALAEDDDLQPLPAVVDRMRRAIRQQAPALLEPPAPRVTVSEYLADPQRVPPPTPGPSGLDLVELGDLVPVRGLALTGPGADAAARALLVAVLASGGTGDPDAQGALVIPAATLQRLAGVEPDQVKQLSRLQVSGSAEEAVALLEEIHLHRRRILDEYDADDAEALRGNPTSPPMPQVVLLTDAPTDEHAQQLAALLDQGQNTDLVAVLLGDWPSGDTVMINLDGIVAGSDGPVRVAVLDAPTSRDLLGVLAEAEPAHEEALTVEVPSVEPLERLPAQADVALPPAATADKVRIRIFGKVAVLDAEGQPVPGLRQHAGGLLAYLAIHRKGADKNDILEAIWPDAPLRRAAERLSTEVGNLRRCIRAASADQSAQPVVNTGGRYHLSPDVVNVDLWRFEDAVHQAAETPDPVKREHWLADAVGFAVAGAARGLDHHWLEPVREQLRRKAIRAHLQLADLVSADDARRAAAITQGAATLDATNEALSRRAIAAHARNGDQTALEAELRRLRAALREIDEAPSPETLALAAVHHGAG